MGKSRSHSGRANFNYILKQLKKSNTFELCETKNGILIRGKNNLPKSLHNLNVGEAVPKQYIIHTDSKKLHELRRWLKREYKFILELKK